MCDHDITIIHLVNIEIYDFLFTIIFIDIVVIKQLPIRYTFI